MPVVGLPLSIVFSIISENQDQLTEVSKRVSVDLFHFASCLFLTSDFNHPKIARQIAAILSVIPVHDGGNQTWGSKPDGISILGGIHAILAPVGFL